MTEETLRTFVGQLLREMESLAIKFEIIVVANYDLLSDSTPQVAKELSETDSRIRFIAQEKQGKMGWDMKTGLDAAKGNYLAVIDGDGQMPSSDIPVVYKIIAAGNFDLVKTFRLKRFDGFYRYLISRVYNVLFGLLYRTDFASKDINSKPKIFSRQAYQKMQLISNDWFTDTEIMLEANRLKLRICEVATVFYKNERRSSFIRPGTIFEFMRNLIQYRSKYN